MHARTITWCSLLTQPARLRSSQDYFYGFIILIGVIISTVFGPKGEGHYTLADLLDMWANPVFIVMEVFVIASLAAGWTAIKTRPARLEPLQPLIYGYMAGCLGGQQNIMFKVRVTHLHHVQGAGHSLASC
jgi:hypothetical protein